MVVVKYFWEVMLSMGIVVVFFEVELIVF